MRILKVQVKGERERGGGGGGGGVRTRETHQWPFQQSVSHISSENVQPLTEIKPPPSNIGDLVHQVRAVHAGSKHLSYWPPQNRWKDEILGSSSKQQQFPYRYIYDFISKEMSLEVFEKKNVDILFFGVHL